MHVLKKQAQRTYLPPLHDLGIVARSTKNLAQFFVHLGLRMSIAIEPLEYLLYDISRNSSFSWRANHKSRKSLTDHVYEKDHVYNISSHSSFTLAANHKFKSLKDQVHKNRTKFLRSLPLHDAFSVYICVCVCHLMIYIIYMCVCVCVT